MNKKSFKVKGSYGIDNIWDQIRTYKPRKKRIQAYHVLSTKPFQMKHNSNSRFEMTETEKYTMVLSALAWQKYNGPISLITDNAGKKYVREAGIERYYSECLDILEDSLDGINHLKFWAASKIKCLNLVSLPCVILDLDFIVWSPLPENMGSLAVAHKEPINKFVYPDFKFFSMSRNYIFPAEWSDKVEALNTAILYINDSSLRDYYTSEAFRFIYNERNTPNDGMTCMVFAEQRILGMCASVMNVKPFLLLDYKDLGKQQQLITHLWSGKHRIEQDKVIKQHYLDNCLEKIKIFESEYQIK